jgi:peptide/nickel transport system substrate-binding protein
MFTNGSDQPEPTNWFHDWTSEAISSKANEWRGNNYERWSNPDFDKMWSQLKTESDTAKRKNLAIQMNDLLVSQVVIIPLVSRKFPVASKNKQLQGVNPSPWDGDLWNIADWSKTGG